MIAWSPQQYIGHRSLITPNALICDQLLLQSHITAAGWTHCWSGEDFCNNSLQKLWGAKSWCRYRSGFSWYRENFPSDSPLSPPIFVLDVYRRDRASLGNYPPFPLSIMFTFAAFCYMLSLVLCVSLIFFAIWHVSTFKSVYVVFRVFLDVCTSDAQVFCVIVLQNSHSWAFIHFKWIFFVLTSVFGRYNPQRDRCAPVSLLIHICIHPFHHLDTISPVFPLIWLL